MSVQSETRTFKANEAVKINPDYAGKSDIGKVFRVEKVPAGARGVNYTIKPIGAGVGLRAPAYMLVPATEAEIARAEAQAPEGERPVLGSVVQIAHPKAGDGYYVVTSAKRDGTYQVAALGGDNGRYFPSIPLGIITVVDPATVKIG